MEASKFYGDQFIHSQKEKLETRLGDLTDRSNERGQFEDSDSEIDPNEAAGIVANQYNNQAEKATLDKEIIEVQAALNRIDDNTYGACIKCGNWIDKARLEVVPAASICMNH